MSTPSSIYSPTPKEEAYGLYLLKSVFHIDGSVDDASVRITGRLAVPFLSKSNVNRLVLRNVWTVVDPTNSGNLTDRKQFYIVLRLISLAQVGILSECLTDAYRASVGPVTAMQACLRATQQDVSVPLAQFDGVSIPDDNTLHNIYQDKRSGGGTVSLGGGSGAGSVFGGATQSTSVAPATSSSSSSFGSSPSNFPIPFDTATSAAAPPPHRQPQLSIDDAFGELVQVEDAPLPSLGPPPRSYSNSSSLVGSMTSGGGGAGASHQLNLSSVPSDVSTSSAPMESTFWPSSTGLSFDGVTPTATTTQSLGTANASAGPVDPFASLSGLSSRPPLTATSSIGSAESAPTTLSSPPWLQASPSATENSSTAAAGFPGTSTSNNMLPVSEAFGDIMDVPDRPLPDLSASVASTPTAEQASSLPPPQPLPAVAAVVSDVEIEDDDEFGEFHAVSSTPASGDDVVAGSAQLSRPAGALSTTTTTTGWEALDALASTELQDAPLPSLQQQPQQPSVDVVGSLTTTATTSADSVSIELQAPSAMAPATGSDDLFGTAATMPTAATVPPVQQQQQDNYFGGGGGSFEVAAAAAAAAASSSSDFSPEPQGPVATSSTEFQQQAQHEDDDFGVFSSASTSAAETASPPQATMGLGALDSLGEVENAPLPALGQLGGTTDSSTSPIKVEGVDQDDTDGFCDFVGTDQAEEDLVAGQTGPINSLESSKAQSSSPAPAPAPDSGWDALDALAGTEDAPLPSLQSYSADSMAIGEVAGSAELQQQSSSTTPKETGNSTNQAASQLLSSTSDAQGLEKDGAGGDNVEITGTANANANMHRFSVGATGNSNVSSVFRGTTSSTEGSAGPSSDKRPLPPKGSMHNADRHDSEFYSATASSAAASSAYSDDLEGFESALENEEDEQKEASLENEEIEGKEDKGSFPSTTCTPTPALDAAFVPSAATSGPTAVDSSDDPFSAFDTLASPQPELPPLTSFEEAEEEGKAENPATDMVVDAEDDEFGGFEAAPVLSEEVSYVIEVHKGGAEAEAEGDDDFGNFSAFEGPSEELQPSPPQTSAETEFQTRKEPTGGDEIGMTSQVTNATVDIQTAGREGLGEDDFRDFSGFQGSSEDKTGMQNPNDTVGDFVSSEPVVALNVGNEEENEFEDFGTAGASDIGSSDKKQETPPADDLDFGAFECGEINESTSDGNAPNTGVDDEEEEFGGFGGAEGFGAFGTADVEQLEIPASKPQGGLGSEKDLSPVTDNVGSGTRMGEEEEDFQAFESGEINESTSGDNAPNNGADDEEEDFGNFDSAEEDFGNFDSAELSPPPAAGIEDENEKEMLALVRKQIIVASLRIPEAIRRQIGKRGDHVDFGHVFDSNIGFDVPCSDERKKRASCCLFLMDLLSNRYSKLASTYWEQCISVACEELSMGYSVLEQATNLMPRELALCRGKLETYIYGLGEFVRVVRSIVASIGDILMLDLTALLTIDTLASSWCSISLLKGALQVEKHWKNIEDVSNSLKLTSKQEMPHRLETLVEIRTIAEKRRSHMSRSEQICSFTLQPLPSTSQHQEHTKTPVVWQSNYFMACTANFLKNKCTFYVVEA